MRVRARSSSQSEGRGDMGAARCGETLEANVEKPGRDRQGEMARESGRDEVG